MKLAEVASPTLREFESKIGSLICASGYESRSRFLAETIEQLPPKRHVLGFREHRRICARQENDTFFRAKKFTETVVSGGEAGPIRELVTQELETHGRTGRPLLVDISSMTRVWYAAVIGALREARINGAIDVYFTYSVGDNYARELHPGANEVAGPLEGFISLSPPSHPVALALGMGFEKERAIGLQELLEPSRTLFFVPDRLGVNSGQLVPKKAERVSYSLRDPVGSFGSLESACHGLERGYAIVLVSLGPKIFSLVCLLVASVNPAVSVWRVSAGMSRKPQDIKALHDGIVCCRTRWSS